MSKCQPTEECTRKVCALLYYVHVNTYNQIKLKSPRVTIMKFYRLVQFHIQGRFNAIPSIRVYNPGQPVTYARQFYMNKPGHKIYLCMSAGSTRNYILLNNAMIIHTKIFLRQPVNHGRKYLQRQTVTFFTATPARASHVIVHFYRFHQVGSFSSWSKYKQVDSTKTSQFKHKLKSKHLPFPFLRVRVRFQPATHPQ